MAAHKHHLLVAVAYLWQGLAGLRPYPTFIMPTLPASSRCEVAVGAATSRPNIGALDKMVSVWRPHQLLT